MSDDPLRLHSFHVANGGDWVAVFIEPDKLLEPDDGSPNPPYRVEPIVGWVVMLNPDDGFDIHPVIGGDLVEWTNDYAGIYQRAELNNAGVRQRLRDLATVILRQRGGCGAP